MRLLKIAAINFLNPAPLMWDFEHEPGKSRLAERYSIHQTTPAACADELVQGTADIGLVPVATYASEPSLAVVPGCTIASLGDIRSILLVVRHADGVKGVRRIALDTSSRTSAVYTRILFHKYWNAAAEFVPHAPDLEAMLKVADAALLIGDPALLALEDREAREQRTGEKLMYLDLGHEWHALTGSAWVSAFWAVRLEGLRDASVRAESLVRDFQESRNNGLAHVDDLVAEWSRRLAVPAQTIHAYLTRNIHYHLDAACLEGLRLFYRYGIECRALPIVPELRFL
ncbi:menaquinone biosynthesis protein [Alloacidobacterium dinghuense]|uniref:Chorismate dehydratase n=1 Tax=Alloacidobacterium dinghuense TaxID=2763107 RepID=A0A7G8BJ68_9BACT|nr:menaquinone biosynthesis protein [Alloacidobacterium dinghuense]QNI32588.1 menaquinone biosynthesis protein [Alloacidobacterium dinghuense]